MSRRFRRLVRLPALFCLVWPTAALSQEEPPCVVLCAPELNFEPTLTVENLFARPRVATLQGGAPVDTTRLAHETAFEAILAVDVPTEIPRVGLTLEVIWPPFADDNELELELELNLLLLTEAETGGWADAHFDIVDQFSPAERPGSDRAYTHKLDFELDVAVAVLRWLPEGNWLRGLELEGSLDYLATGLPRRGDEVPSGEGVFLDDASGWSFSALLVLPLAPLAR